jgi:MFS family permease
VQEQQPADEPVGLGAPTTTGFRGAWRHRQWRRLISSFALSATGDWMYSVALFVWLLDRTGSATWIAAAVLLGLVPGAVFGPLAGVVADRWDRRRLLVGLDVARGAVMLAIALVVASDGAPIVAVTLVGLDAVLASALRPAIGAVTPQVVDEDSLAAANAVASAVGQVTWFLGPALGSLVLQAASPAWALVANALAFFASAILLLGLRLPGHARIASGERGPSFLVQLREGGVIVRRDPDLLVLLGLVSAVLFAYGFESVLHVLVASDRLGIGAAGLGWMTAAVGIGALVAAPFTMRVAETTRAGQALAVSAMLLGGPLALLAVITSPAVAYAILFLEGIGSVFFEVLVTTLLQRLVPRPALGRVFGLQDSAGAALNIVGALVAPFLVSAVSLEFALVVGGGSLVVFAILALPGLALAGRHAQQAADELQPRVAVLAKLPFLGGAAPDVLASIAASIIPEDVAAGRIVLAEGAPADDLFVVRSGSLEVFRNGLKVTEVGADDVIGEIGVVNRRPRNATVIASTPVNLWRIPGAAFLTAIERHDVMPDGLRRGIADRLAQGSVVEVTA